MFIKLGIIAGIVILGGMIFSNEIDNLFPTTSASVFDSLKDDAANFGSKASDSVEQRIDESIELLKQFINDSSIEPLIAALEALKKDPDNASLLDDLTKTFAALGIVQGSVLTYAPYVGIILSDDIFGDSFK